MEVVHRDYVIEVKREKSLGGDKTLYVTITRIFDGFVCFEEVMETDGTVRSMVSCTKERIDNELAKDVPWMEREGFAGFCG